MFFFLFRILIIWEIICISSATLSPPTGAKKAAQKNEIKPQSGPRKNDVIERGLVQRQPMVKDILRYCLTYYEDTSARNFNYMVLGYVTPWNNKGYDVAKTWAPKFNYISPVWLQIQRQDENTFNFNGLHDVDHAWMMTIRRNAGKTNLKILPRILLENWNLHDLQDFFTGPTKEQETLTKEIVKICKQWKFDGIVLELLSQLGGKYSQPAIQFVQKLSLAMAESSLDLILVYPPFRGYPKDEYYLHAFDLLYPYVTAISLMTYDFSTPQKPGANAPLPWVKKAVEKLAPDGSDDVQEKRAKILLGLNFYGNSYTANGGGPIVGHEYQQLLKSAKPSMTLEYNNSTGEQYIEVRSTKGVQKIFYPTLYSISLRISLARELGTGLAIWELGQGLDYFMDLF